MKEQQQAKLDRFLARTQTSLFPPTSLHKALGITSRVASAMSSAIQPPRKEDLKQWFEDGRLPCSFSTQLPLQPILAQLDHLEQFFIKKREAIVTEQQEKEKAFIGAQTSSKKLEEVSLELSAFEEAVLSHEEKEKSLLAELEPFQKLDMIAFRLFVQSAAQVEKDLVSQLEAQLANGMEALFALNEEGSPKLSLLLNCFGAEAGTIQVLSSHLNSVGLVFSDDEEVKSMISVLPRDQQIVVLNTRDRLKIEGTPSPGDVGSPHRPSEGLTPHPPPTPDGTTRGGHLVLPAPERIGSIVSHSK